MNWHDLTYLIAVAETGTLSAAADTLGVTHTTVARRLQVLEQSLGARLFNRSDRQWVLTSAGELALNNARTMQETAISLQRSVGNLDEALVGSIRITAINSFIHRFIARHIGDFLARYPNIQLELVGSHDNLNLSRREADIAIRLARPQTGTMLIRKLADVGFAVYGSQTAFADTEVPLEQLPWAVYDEAYQHLPEFQWIKQHVKTGPWQITANDNQTMLELLRQGVVVGILPCSTGDAYSDLHRLSGAKPIVSRELWLLTHQDLRSVARVRCFTDWLVAKVDEHKAVLAG